MKTLMESIKESIKSINEIKVRHSKEKGFVLNIFPVEDPVRTDHGQGQFATYYVGWKEEWIVQNERGVVVSRMVIRRSWGDFAGSTDLWHVDARGHIVHEL